MLKLKNAAKPEWCIKNIKNRWIISITSERILYYFLPECHYEVTFPYCIGSVAFKATNIL